MPHFGRRSFHQLRTCDPQVQRLFERVVLQYDCTVLIGHRGARAQHEAFLAGKSEKDWPDGEHNEYPSKAADVAPWPIDWENWKRFYHFGGYVLGVAELLGIPIRWGGDWDRDHDLDDQDFNDLVHFELEE
ncbi:MAG: M15 family peptidase [Gemmatimonadota bacterium]